MPKSLSSCQIMLRSCTEVAHRSVLWSRPKPIQALHAIVCDNVHCRQGDDDTDAKERTNDGADVISTLGTPTRAESATCTHAPITSPTSRRSTQASLSSQDSTSILDKNVLQWMGVQLTSLLGKYVLLWMGETLLKDFSFSFQGNSSTCVSTCV